MIPYFQINRPTVFGIISKSVQLVFRWKHKINNVWAKRQGVTPLSHHGHASCCLPAQDIAANRRKSYIYPLTPTPAIWDVELCWFKVGPASATVTQLQTNIGSIADILYVRWAILFQIYPWLIKHCKPITSRLDHIHHRKLLGMCLYGVSMSGCLIIPYTDRQ